MLYVTRGIAPRSKNGSCKCLGLHPSSSKCASAWKSPPTLPPRADASHLAADVYVQRARNAYVRDRSLDAPALNSLMIRRALAAILFLVSATGGSALAAPSAAVFPFEIFDTSGEQSSAGREARLEMATRVLAESLAKSELFSPVDLTPLAAEVKATSPRYNCGNCFLPVAREAGAAVAVVPFVHKVSTLITTMDIWIFDVATGDVIVHASGQIRGDTDDAYAHGVRFLVKNRIVDTKNAEEAPAK